MTKKEENKTDRHITLRIDQELYQLLKNLSEQKERTISWIVRDAIKETVKTSLKK